jgi:hypothetical protein
MKISFDEILPPDVLLYVGTKNNSNISILGAFWTKMYFFRPFDLENYCQGHIFPRSQYQKRLVGEKLKILSYITFTEKSETAWVSLGASSPHRP